MGAQKKSDVRTRYPPCARTKSCADPKIVCAVSFGVRIRRACARLFRSLRCPKYTPEGLRAHAPRIRTPKDIVHTNLVRAHRRTCAHTEGHVRTRGYHVRPSDFSVRPCFCVRPWGVPCAAWAHKKVRWAHKKVRWAHTTCTPPCAPRNSMCGTRPGIHSHSFHRLCDRLSVTDSYSPGIGFAPARHCFPRSQQFAELAGWPPFAGLQHRAILRGRLPVPAFRWAGLSPSPHWPVPPHLDSCLWPPPTLSSALPRLVSNAPLAGQDALPPPLILASGSHPLPGE
jgi:hypothetical protein